MPQDRPGRFRTEGFARYQRSEKARVAALAEMDGPGVSPRKIKAITEELWGYEFRADAISQINRQMDGQLPQWSERALEEEYPDLILDVRSEKVRDNGALRSRAVLVALANRASATGWKEFLLRLKTRGLTGVRLAISDDHAGLKTE